jgi:hypothetical protein
MAKKTYFVGASHPITPSDDRMYGPGDKLRIDPTEHDERLIENGDLVEVTEVPDDSPYAGWKQPKLKEEFGKRKIDFPKGAVKNVDLIGLLTDDDNNRAGDGENTTPSEDAVKEETPNE